MFCRKSYQKRAESFLGCQPGKQQNIAGELATLGYRGPGVYFKEWGYHSTHYRLSTTIVIDG